MGISAEGKPSMDWLWILLAMLVVVLLLLWMLDQNEESAEPIPVSSVAAIPADATADQAAPLSDPLAQGFSSSIAAIIRNPTASVGQTFSLNVVQVASVPTDKGFWIRDKGQQLFVLLTGRGESSPNINPGQTVWIREGVLRDASFLQQGQIAGYLDEHTRRIVEGQKVFLALDAGDVIILSRSATDVRRSGSKAAALTQ